MPDPAPRRWRPNARDVGFPRPILLGLSVDRLLLAVLRAHTRLVAATAVLTVVVWAMMALVVGSTFGPVLLLPTALGVTFVATATWVAGSLLVARIGGVDLATALLVSAPGSPAETTAVAEEAGLRVQLVAAVQLGRVLAVFCVAGFLARCS